MQVAKNLRFGLVGPGRRRQGLGPFLAAHVEAAGARVVAAAGRDLARTEEDALQLSNRLGHAVTAHASVAGMATSEALDALIIAAPVSAHREVLEAALVAGLPVLCEKPLVAPEELDGVGELLDRFLQSGLLLMEHCQWPLTLSALTQLHPGFEGRAIDRVELMICPGARGRQMIEDSLSHLLSLVQALVPVDETTVLRGVEFTTH
ncbi:MAG: Gfo/Idh/MocA family oxidoreductase, partial [Planctomycetota bacterium]|nr:Gfo/Idh/MocA family oxidoreductase [Planctomycetota bacterium]